MSFQKWWAGGGENNNNNNNNKPGEKQACAAVYSNVPVPQVRCSRWSQRKHVLSSQTGVLPRHGYKFQ